MMVHRYFDHSSVGCYETVLHPLGLASNQPKRTFTMSVKNIDNAVAALAQRIHVPSRNVREQKRWLSARDKLCTKCGETDDIQK
jgi:hypothetical protein